MAPKYRYQPLRDQSAPSPVKSDFGAVRRPRGPQARRLALALGLAFMALVVMLFVSTWGEMPQLPFLSSCHNRPDGYQCKPEISHFWGQYSPYHAIPSELPAEIPSNCEVTFAQVLSRHGSRDPTFGRTVIMSALLEKLQEDVREFTGPYAFLKKRKYNLGADQLTGFGQGELVRSGTAFYQRYRSLANASAPFVRAAGQRRVIESAVNFTQGMYAAALDDDAKSAKAYPLAVTVIPEGSASNNTLSAELCDAARYEPYASIGRRAQQKWASIFAPPIVERLNIDLPGASLTLADIIVLMDFCPFTTVASLTGVPSLFCSLFTEDEWRDYDYFQTLGKYYGYGPGHPLGATQGVGWVNELIARLTGQPVTDHTSVNHTLDGSPQTFPIGSGHALFADFSHDNDMIAIYSALGLYNASAPLDQTRRTPARQADGFASSWTVPFAGRLYVEKMRCRPLHTEVHGKPLEEVEKGPDDGDELVRILVNDRVIPLANCGADALGRCRLKAFVKSLGFAKAGGKWDECFKKHDESVRSEVGL